MATTRLSPRKKTNPRGPMVLLSAAICEWFLIFLLFIDATFSYILRRFAEYSELPTPCLFCSRIDTPFGKRKFEGYNALLCRSHKEEISSLVCCHVHGNLTDVREMCEECFIPGSLGSDIEQHSVQKILPTSSGPKICQCCNKSWGAKPIAQRFLEMAPVSFGVSVANVKPPLPQVPGRSRFSRKNNFKKLRNRFSAPATPQPDGKSLGDALSNVGYKELKYTSDSESEFPFSDEEEGVFGVQGRNDMNPEPNPHYVARSLLKLQTNDSALEKESNHSVEDVTSLLDQPMQLETQESLPTHGLEDLNWDQLHPSTDIPVSPELNLLDDVIKHLSNVSGDATLSVEPQPQTSSSDILSEPITLSNSPLCINDKNQETLKSKDEDDILIARQPINGTSSSASSDEEKVVSTTSVDLPSASDSTKFEDIKSVLEQSTPEQADSQKEISTTSVELPPASESTEFEATTASDSTELQSVIQQSAPKQDDFPDVGASSSDGNHVQAVASLERNDSSLKFSERVNLSDVEGESSVDMLKNQLEHVKKCMNDLYKELEEERNASAVAANQAMAMITRLQEEKAALHMEASQYLRMMDEQAEYDVDALQKANDLLAEKEKQLQDLEYEVESYRNNIHGGPPVIDPHNGSISTMEQNTTGDLSIRLNGSITCEPSSSESSKLSIADDIPGYAKSTMSNLEEEKLSLQDYLKKLERTMHVVSCNNTPRVGLNNSRHHGLNPNTTDFQENPPTNDEDDSEKEADGLPMQHWLGVVDRTSEDSPTSQFDDSDAYCEETNHNRSNWQHLSIAGHEPTMETFENEIAHFKERLKAFEGDWEFIKHSLKNFKVDMKGWNIFNR
ncbi:hypothetical protein Leryth_010564 [Lithospermum erythrorhizon]|nr:hypothetical protein Leryth_010564 [Lithospermum erythrorhizon]